MRTEMRIEILEAIDKEIQKKRDKGRVIKSPHEGWALIYEELDELWEEVRKKIKKQDREKMKNEAMQIAATAIRFIEDLCEGD